MAWEENSRICLHMQLIAILSRIGVNNNRDTLSDKPKKKSLKNASLSDILRITSFFRKFLCLFLFLPFVFILLIFAVFLSCKFIVFARECFVSFHVNIAIDAVVVRASVNIVFIV